MRIYSRLLLMLSVFVGCASQASADQCGNGAVNNPAFSSDVSPAMRPCPPPAKPELKSQPGAVKVPASGQQPAATSVNDPDKATIKKSANGTLMKFGDTTVCVSGAIVVDVTTAKHAAKPSRPTETPCE